MNGPTRAAAFIAILCVFFSVMAPNFLGFANFANLLLASATLGILAIGASFVLTSRGLDLSIGSVMALSGITASWLTLQLSLSWPLTVLACLLVGAGVGALNGLLIGFIRIPAFIVTLGMLSIARGVSLIVTDGRPIYGLDQSLLFLGQGRIFGLPVPVIILIAVAIIAWVLLHKTPFGWHTLALGSNEEAARNAGVQTRRHKIWLYALSGMLAGVAGLIFMARVNAADPSIGQMYELTAITAAIIGGTSLFGGRASIIGAVLGAVLMGVIQNGLNLMAIPSYYQQIAIGFILIAALWLDQATKRRQG